MFDYKLDVGEMLGEIKRGERYVIFPSEIGERKDLFEELGGLEVSDTDFWKMCGLHGTWQIPGLPGLFREKYGLSDEQELLLEFLIENAIIHGNEMTQISK
ncbi:MAG: hypothetical protein JW727_01055 [Candidatus Aenigmarchaeota archaeon]|nr:hypothetical protein [Candidatus Aenigmarchaeota archaeon]